MTPTSRESRTPLNEATQLLATKYIPLARSIAKPFKMNWPTHRDDFESAAMMSLVEAAGTYDKARGVKFSAFARHRIWGSLRDVQRAATALGWRSDPKNSPKIASMPRNPEGKGRVLGSETMKPVGQEFDEMDSIEFILKGLPKKHAQVCRQVYLHGQTQSEAAAVVGCSQSRFSYLHREAMDILSGRWKEKLLAKAG